VAPTERMNELFNQPVKLTVAFGCSLSAIR
jgi:hypothetical protein